MSATLLEAQQAFAENSGHKTNVIWDALHHNQGNVLKEKIAALIGGSELPNSKLSDQRNAIFESVWAQRTYTNKLLFSSIIYVLVTEEQEDWRTSKKYSCHPVFRTRKCLRGEDRDSYGCCMMFIDEHGRVYDRWANYLEYNVLPKGTMVAPNGGVYQFDKSENVLLIHQPTPASSATATLVNYSDSVMAAAGLASLVPVVGAAFIPGLLPFVAAAEIIGGSTTIYSTGRSISALFDRWRHGQSNNALANADARSTWLNVATGVGFVGSLGAMKALKSAGKAGNQFEVARQVATGANVATGVISSASAVNGVYDIFMKRRDDEPITGLDILQLTASLVVFTHSLNNLKLVNKSKTPRQLRSNLNKAMKKNFCNNRGGSRYGDLVRVFDSRPCEASGLSNCNESNGLLVSVSLTGSLLFVLKSAGNSLYQMNWPNFTTKYGKKFVDGIRSVNNFMDLLSHLISVLTEAVTDVALQIAGKIIEDLFSLGRPFLRVVISSEQVLSQVMISIKTYVLRGFKSTISNFAEEIRGSVLDRFKDLLMVDSNDPKNDCPHCLGYYYVTAL